MRECVKRALPKKESWYRELQKQDGRIKIQRINQKEALFFAWYDELIASIPDVPQFLHRQDITEIIIESFRFFDNRHYTLLAYCIMPNHVHVLIKPFLLENGKIYPLAHITYTWKKYTAAKINKLLGRKGNLWQQESFDHMVRNDNKLQQTLHYIVQNPVKAGLAEKWGDWRGTWIHDDLIAIVEQHAVAAKEKERFDTCNVELFL